MNGSPRRLSAAQKKNYDSREVYRSMGNNTATRPNQSSAAAAAGGVAGTHFAAWESHVNRLSQPHQHQHQQQPHGVGDEITGDVQSELCDVCDGDAGICHDAVAGCIQCAVWLCGVHVIAHTREKHKYRPYPMTCT
jgi:hypothetical protein